MASYLIALLLAFVGPFLLSFHWHVRKAIWTCPRRLLLSLLTMSVPFWVWDAVVTARGHWSFSEAHTLPLRLVFLPVEEWLFFPVVGFIAIFLWEVIGYYQSRRA